MSLTAILQHDADDLVPRQNMPGVGSRGASPKITNFRGVAAMARNKRQKVTPELRARVQALFAANPKLFYREVSEIVGLSLNAVRCIKLNISYRHTNNSKPAPRIVMRLPAEAPKPVEGSIIRPLDKKALMAGNGRCVKTRAA